MSDKQQHYLHHHVPSHHEAMVKRLFVLGTQPRQRKLWGEEMKLLLLCLCSKLVNSEAAACKPWLLQGREAADSDVELRPASFPLSLLSIHFFQSKAILQREQPCLALQDNQQNNRMGGVSLCGRESIGMSWQIVQEGSLCRTSAADLRGAGSQGHLGSGAH